MAFNRNRGRSKVPVTAARASHSSTRMLWFSAVSGQRWGKSGRLSLQPHKGHWGSDAGWLHQAPPRGRHQRAQHEQHLQQQLQLANDITATEYADVLN